MKTMTVLCHIMLLFALSGTSFAETLLFVTTDFPPAVIIEQGNIKGTDTDVVREICRVLGIEPEISIVPWARALKEVQDGDAAAIYSPKDTDERREYLYFTTEPINSERVVAVARKEDSITITTLNDLNGKSVGIVRGFTYGAKFDAAQGFDRIVCSDDVELLKVLDKKRIDVGIINERKFEIVSRQFGSRERLEVVYVVSEEFSYIGVSKKLGARGEQLAQQFSDVLRQLRENGTLDAIKARYFSNIGNQ